MEGLRGGQNQFSNVAKLACALGGVGSPVRPFARPPDRPETCENHKKTTKIIGKLPKTIKIYKNHRKTSKIALARSPVAKSGPAKASHDGCLSVPSVRPSHHRQQPTTKTPEQVLVVLTCEELTFAFPVRLAGSTSATCCFLLCSMLSLHDRTKNRLGLRQPTT